MHNTIKLLLALCLLVVIGCEKENTVPTPPPAPTPTDDTRNIVQAENAFTQLFSVTAYGTAMAALQQAGIPTPCGSAQYYNVTGGYGITLDFDNCTLAPGLVVDGTLDFETFGATNPSDNDANTDLYFTSFTINGCEIINLSPGSFIRFTDIADPTSSYDLYEVFAPQTFRVNHTLDNNYTIFMPFNTNNIPQEDRVHLKVRTDPKLDADFSVDNASAFLDELYNTEFTLKIEERPNATGQSDDRWRARTFTQGGEYVQTLQLITETDPGNSDLEDIDGLKLSMQCGHFKGGTLILNKSIDVDFDGDGEQQSLGCFYPFQEYNFDYDMQPGDVHKDPIDCSYTLPPADTEACDGWALRTNYGVCTSTVCTVCNSPAQTLNPDCQVVECW